MSAQNSFKSRSLRTVLRNGNKSRTSFEGCLKQVHQCSQIAVRGRCRILLQTKFANSIDLEWEQLERDLLIPLMEEERAARIWAARFGMCRSVSYYASLFYFAHRIASLPYSRLCTWLLSYL